MVPLAALAAAALFTTHTGAAAAEESAAACPIKAETTVAYFAGDGATADCQDWEKHFFAWWGRGEPRIVVQRMTAAATKRCDLARYPNLKLWVQPGGNAYDQQKALGPEGKANILKYLQAGNSSHYLGTCAGWFVASTDYWWQGAHFAWPDTLGIFETVEGSITNIWDDTKPPGYALTTVTAAAGAAGSREGTELTALYWGGPTRGWNATPNSVTGKPLLTFSSIPGHLPASVLDGRHLFFSAHLEAYEGHPSGVHLNPVHREQNYRFRADQINQLTGENWTLPPVADGA
jgi:hypothetical protein